MLISEILSCFILRETFVFCDTCNELSIALMTFSEVEFQPYTQFLINQVARNT